MQGLISQCLLVVCSAAHTRERQSLLTWKQGYNPCQEDKKVEEQEHRSTSKRMFAVVLRVFGRELVIQVVVVRR